MYIVENICSSTLFISLQRIFHWNFTLNWTSCYRIKEKRWRIPVYWLMVLSDELKADWPSNGQVSLPFYQDWPLASRRNKEPNQPLYMYLTQLYLSVGSLHIRMCMFFGICRTSGHEVRKKRRRLIPFALSAVIITPPFRMFAAPLQHPAVMLQSQPLLSRFLLSLVEYGIVYPPTCVLYPSYTTNTSTECVTHQSVYSILSTIKSLIVTQLVLLISELNMDVRMLI